MTEVNNGKFRVLFDEETGMIKSWFINGDKSNADLIEPGYPWGRVYGYDSLPKVTVEEDGIKSVFYGKVTLTVTRRVTADALEESYVFTNNKNVDYFIRENEWGIYLPFHSCTSEREEDLYHTRFITDLWCGGDICWAKTTRFSGEDPWLLTYMTKGKVNSYSMERDFKSGNDYRGTLVLNPAPKAIEKGGSLEIALRHTFEKGSLEDALKRYDGHLELSAEYYSVYIGEALKLKGSYSGTIETASVSLDGKEIPFTVNGNEITADYVCESAGERKFVFTVNGKSSFIVTNTLLPLKELLKKRARFIAEKQQYIL